MIMLFQIRNPLVQAFLILISLTRYAEPNSNTELRLNKYRSTERTICLRNGLVRRLINIDVISYILIKLKQIKDVRQSSI
jgi:hypothetical protein